MGITVRADYQSSIKVLNDTNAVLNNEIVSSVNQLNKLIAEYQKTFKTHSSSALYKQFEKMEEIHKYYYDCASILNDLLNTLNIAVERYNNVSGTSDYSSNASSYGSNTARGSYTPGNYGSTSEHIQAKTGDPYRENAPFGSNTASINAISGVTPTYGPNVASGAGYGSNSINAISGVTPTYGPNVASGAGYGSNSINAISGVTPTYGPNVASGAGYGSNSINAISGVTPPVYSANASYGPNTATVSVASSGQSGSSSNTNPAERNPYAGYKSTGEYIEIAKEDSSYNSGVTVGPTREQREAEFNQKWDAQQKFEEDTRRPAISPEFSRYISSGNYRDIETAKYEQERKTAFEKQEQFNSNFKTPTYYENFDTQTETTSPVSSNYGLTEDQNKDWE